MKEELEQKLFDEFPSLFADRTEPETKSLMCYGIEVEDGWYDVLYRLCTRLVALKDIGDFRFFQIKEKFGDLRIYANGTTQEAYGLIDMAEQESSKTCEYCGSVNDVRHTGKWIKTLCFTCRTK
jgi:uncharacterized Zn-finger protein